LDAHWENYCPLRDELKTVRSLPFPVVIIIDDFKTPNRDFQFDRYGSHECSIDYVKDFLPEGGTYYYLNRSERPNRGVGKLYWVPDNGDGLFYTDTNGERYSVL
jgi:hypothetical protein